MTIPTDEQTAYDKVPYESQPFPQTHPDRLATLGRLFGMAPPPIVNCRVLELGCASGGNLIPMAFHLPESEFIGVDASLRQIEQGRQRIAALGLGNIRLLHKNILDLDSAIGNVDYVITHGVYSWVPEAVQEKILAIAASHLTPQGIAYVSYNTYPGWHMRQMIRQMMLFHVQPFESPEERTEQARALLDFLSGAVPTENNHYGMMLKEELDLIRRVKDWYLFHDHLEEVNSPLYFHEFNDRVRRHGLQYLAEADFSSMLSKGLSDETAATLNRICPDIIRSEQYMDFIRNRYFRQTLLCRETIDLKRELQADDVSDFLIASSARPQNDPPNLQPGVREVFETTSGLTITTPSPITKAALCVLSGHWPCAMALETLYQSATSRIAEASSRTGTSDGENRRGLFTDLIHCFTQNVVELHAWQAPMVNVIGERPKISRLAAGMVASSPIAINQRHEIVRLAPVAHRLAVLLDGRRTYSQLHGELVAQVLNGNLVYKQNDIPLKDARRIDPVMNEAVTQALQFLRDAAMLVA